MRWLLVVLGLVAGCAQTPPQQRVTGQEVVRLESAAVAAVELDVVLVLDVSASNTAERLERAQAWARALLGAPETSGSRVALVVFGREAWLAAPLTADLGAVARLLGNADGVDRRGSDGLRSWSCTAGRAPSSSRSRPTTRTGKPRLQSPSTGSCRSATSSPWRVATRPSKRPSGCLGCPAGVGVLIRSNPVASQPSSRTSSTQVLTATVDGRPRVEAASATT